jgi:ubiquinone/menaquinone biosynthesis C-methylase UbiE
MHNNSENYHIQSYKLHQKSYKKFLDENDSISKTWFNENTIDYWRHWRMYLTISPILNYYPNSEWVTIGDGRYGLDSIRLKKINSSLKILTTDISPYLLEESKKMGLISDFSIENAEKLTFSDNYFDFAFCKESYHHFPRPFLAVYEMLRVARKGIVLIEPNDKINTPLLLHILDKLREIRNKIVKRKQQHPDFRCFEESGNYNYTLSAREMEKLSIGLQMPCFGYLYFNDYYEIGLENTNIRKDQELFNKVKKEIQMTDLKCQIGSKSYEHIVIVIFKSMPSENLKKQMKISGFKIIDLPVNPYLSMDA